MLTISKTPLRISLFGGASDLPSYYREETGEVVSMAIDKYVYIVMKPRLDNMIRMNYFHNEIVEDVAALKHELARESLIYMGLKTAVEITSIADLPAGTGVGSSSAYTVGLLNVLHKEYPGPEVLAQEACHIEIDRCGKPIGKQDQYIAAYGGLQHIIFHPDDSVTCTPVNCEPEVLDQLQKGTILFHTGMTRKAEDILKSRMDHSQIRKLVQLARVFKEQLECGDLSNYGELLDESWRIKRGLTKDVSNSFIDHCYEKAKACGANGKICGAGGGGVLMLYADLDKHERIITALSDLIPIQIKIEPDGSKIVFNG